MSQDPITLRLRGKEWLVAGLQSQKTRTQEGRQDGVIERLDRSTMLSTEAFLFSNQVGKVCMLDKGGLCLVPCGWTPPLLLS